MMLGRLTASFSPTSHVSGRAPPSSPSCPSDFLDFLEENARKSLCFRLLMEAEVVNLLEEGAAWSG